MADTRISKIQVRRGNFVDLPLLDAGEMGFATDVQRLFIGNDVVTIGTGDGVTDTYAIPTALSNPTTILGIFVDDVQVNANDYSSQGTVLSFATPPAVASTVTAKYNAEINLNRIESEPLVTTLAASGTLADTGFQVDTTQANAVIMDYTLHTTAGVRIGQLRFTTDTANSTVAIDDNYTETGTVDITFNVDISISDTLKLQYTDNDNRLAKFKYTYQLWNSN